MCSLEAVVKRPAMVDAITCKLADDFHYCKLIRDNEEWKTKKEECFTIYQCQDKCRRKNCTGFVYSVYLSEERGYTPRFSCKLYLNATIRDSDLRKSDPECTAENYYYAYIL